MTKQALENKDLEFVSKYSPLTDEEATCQVLRHGLGVYDDSRTLIRAIPWLIARGHILLGDDYAAMRKATFIRGSVSFLLVDINRLGYAGFLQRVFNTRVHLWMPWFGRVKDAIIAAVEVNEQKNRDISENEYY